MQRFLLVAEKRTSLNCLTAWRARQERKFYHSASGSSSTPTFHVKRKNKPVSKKAAAAESAGTPPQHHSRLQANSKGLMTSWQQERTPKGGPDLGSISRTGTNSLDSACFGNDASKASIYCANCAQVPRNILGRVSLPIFGKEPLAQIFIRHDCRNFWLLDPAALLEQSGRQTLLLTQNTRALKGIGAIAAETWFQ